jgi:hypothetical protein
MTEVMESPPKEVVLAFIDDARRESAGGISVSKFSGLTVSLLNLAVMGCDSLPGTGSQKKQWVLDAVAMLFDAIAIKVCPAIAIPFWIATRPALRKLVLAASAGAIESLLPLVRKK